MLANLDRILKHVRGQKEIGATGQTDLFGGATSSDLQLVELPDWTLDEKLWGERKVLGTFMSGHPITKFASKYEKKITHRMRDVIGIPDSDWPSIQHVTLCGLVVKVYERSFNSVVTLSDETGTADVQFYRDEYERARWVLQKDFIIAVKCKVRRDGSWSGVIGQIAHKVGVFSVPN